jgi:hypothetical protein
MWQEIAVIFIGVITIACTGWKVFRFFSPKEKKELSCCCERCFMKEVTHKNKTCSKSKK